MKYLISIFLILIFYVDCKEAYSPKPEYITSERLIMTVDTLASKSMLKDSIIAVRKPWSDIGGQASMAKVIKSYQQATQAAAVATSTYQKLLDSITKFSKELRQMKAAMVPYDTTIFQIKKGSLSIKDIFIKNQLR